MAAQKKIPEDIFHNAMEISNPSERVAYLDQACQGDEKLRSEVEALLASHEEAGNFLQGPLDDSDVTLDNLPQVDGPGTKIGRYELLRQIGEGGMGLVYLAEQKRPVKRHVALKIIKPGMDSREVIGRFEAERQALALLDHPNIARVFDAGTTKTGRPYFVMEHVKGMSITRYCDDRKLNIEQRLRLFKQVCEGLHHAHQKGIIHRDIKPSNILVSVHGDQAVPKIIDFGIAKATSRPLTDKTVFTFQGQLLGTPEYMSPEQVDLATQDIDTRSDIYSLGVLLYELLAGVLPFEAESLRAGGFAQIQQMIREQEPATPSTRLTDLGEAAKEIARSRKTQVIALARCLHRELEWIPLKAMRKDRCRRYKSASEMADDIQNYLNGNPLIAGPETAMYRMQKFVRKHAGSVVTVILVVVAIVLGLVVSAGMYFRSEKALKREAIAHTKTLEAKENEVSARMRAEGAEQLATQKAEELRRSLYFNCVAHAYSEYRTGNITAVHRLLNSCPSDHRDWEWFYLNNLLDQSTMIFRGHSDEVTCIKLDIHGKRLVSGSLDGTVRIWDTSSGEQLLKLDAHFGGIEAVAFSPTEQHIAFAGENGKIGIYDFLKKEEYNALRGHESRVTCIAYSPDGQRIASGCSSEGPQIGKDTIRVWDVRTGDELLTIPAHHWLQSVAFSSDGRQIVSTGGYDYSVRIWDSRTGMLLESFSGHKSNVSCAVFSPDNKHVISGSGDKTVKLWDVDDCEDTLTLHGSSHEVFSVDMSSDGLLVAAGGWDGAVRMWKLAEDGEVSTFVGHEDAVYSVVFDPSGKRIFSCSGDGTIRAWDTSRRYGTANLQGPLYCPAFSPNGKLIACGVRRREPMVRLFDVKTGELVQELTNHGGYIWSTAFNHDGSLIASGDESGNVTVWNVKTGQQTLSLKAHTSRVECVCFSPSGEHIVSGSRNGIHVWNIPNGKESIELNKHADGIRSISFEPTGKWLASGSNDGMVRIWDFLTAREIASNQIGPISSLAFSPDGKRLIAGGADCTIRVLETPSGKVLDTLHGHDSSVCWVGFTPNAQRIVSGSQDGTIRLWDADTGAAVLTLPRQGEQPIILSMAISYDGKTFAVADLDWQVSLLESELTGHEYRAREDTNMARDIVRDYHDSQESCDGFENYLNGIKGLKETVRQAALRIMEKEKEIESERLWRESWEIVNSSQKNSENFDDALHKAEVARSLSPNDWRRSLMLGLIQYRRGEFELALQSLRLAQEKQGLAERIETSIVEPFIAMALLKIGKKQEAQTTLIRLRSTVNAETFFQDENMQRYLIEAEKLFAEGNQKRETLWCSIESGRYDETKQITLDLQSSGDNETTEYAKSVAIWFSRIYGHIALERARDYTELVACYESAVKLDPNSKDLLRELAWLRATCPEHGLRNGQRAVDTATKACELVSWQEHEFLSTLATAYSEIGDFQAAVEWQRKAMDLMSDEVETSWKLDYASRLALYNSGIPYHRGHLWSLSDGRLVCIWRPDEHLGQTSYDSVDNKWKVKLLGSATVLQDSEMGYVASVGGGDYVELNADDPISGSMSFTVWVRITRSSGFKKIVVKQGDDGFPCWWISNLNNGKAGYGCRLILPKMNITKTVHCDGKVQIDDNKWHNITITFDGKRTCLYVDGTIDAFTSGLWGQIASNNLPIYIGGEPGNKQNQWRGLIDDVRIYSYALSADEVKMLYEGKEPPREKRPD